MNFIVFTFLRIYFKKKNKKANELNYSGQTYLLSALEYHPHVRYASVASAHCL